MTVGCSRIWVGRAPTKVISTIRPSTAPSVGASHSPWAGAMELIDGSPVLYSLGNLVFDLTRSEETVEGLIVEITFVGARPAQVRLHPTVMVDLVQPNLLEAAGDGAVVIERMREASEALPRR